MRGNTVSQHQSEQDFAQATDSLVIAIDGPSGSGKSSTSRGVAERLGLAYLDTGSMYRAIAVAYQQSGLTSDDAQQIAALVSQHELGIGTDPVRPTIRLDGQDITEAIRDPQVSKVVSVVATSLPVREGLTAQMRQVIEDCGRRIVVEGRDITTVVWPDAELRVLLVADPVARIRRRESELAGAADTEAVTDQIVRRDRDDATVSQFQTPAEGVMLVDSTYMNLAEVIEHIVGLVPDGRR